MSHIPARTTTVAEDGSRVWVYPKDIPGTFHYVHRWSSLFLHLFLIVVPWLTIGGHRVLRIDLPARRVWVLGELFTASDGVLLMLMGLFAAFALFFFTSLFGRLWCGYLCPQSVFLINWVLPIETWIEGDRRQRIKRDARGFTWPTTFRKGLKFALFGAIAFALSMAFMGFFSDPHALWTFRAGPANYAVVAFFTGLWFFDFVYFREQVCNYLCPYARFQGALMDDHSLTIMYDEARGEPRGGKGAAKEGRCLDCGWCVEVCPQGIDIRDGFQLECIACGRCVDACTAVMAKASPQTKTLVAYGTVAEQRGEPRRLIRFRTVLYAVILAGVVAGIAAVVGSRAPFEVTVNRAPGSLFQVDEDGAIRNTFLVRLANVEEEPVTLHVAVEGLDHPQVKVPPIKLQPEEVRMVPLVVRVPAEAASQRTYPITVKVSDGEREVSWPTTFKTPGGAP